MVCTNFKSDYQQCKSKMNHYICILFIQRITKADKKSKKFSNACQTIRWYWDFFLNLRSKTNTSLIDVIRIFVSDRSTCSIRNVGFVSLFVVFCFGRVFFRDIVGNVIDSSLKRSLCQMLFANIQYIKHDIKMHYFVPPSIWW